MPSVTTLDDLDVIYKVAASILTSVTTNLSEQGVAIPDRRYVGFADPPEDCCPELVVWAQAPRMWDGDNFDSGLREGRLLYTHLWAIDYRVRFGVCYERNPEPESVATMNRASQELYQIGKGLMCWLSALKTGVVDELQPNDSDFRPGLLTPYAQGGCSGWEATLTVGLN